MYPKWVNSRLGSGGKLWVHARPSIDRLRGFHASPPPPLFVDTFIRLLSLSLSLPVAGRKYLTGKIKADVVSHPRARLSFFFYVNRADEADNYIL